MNRIDGLLQAATARLAALPESTPRLEAEILLSEASGWSRTRLITWPERQLGPASVNAFKALLARRLRGEPVAYIRGRQAFWSLELEVSPETLIPRPETECLVETALELLDAERPLHIADLGTGCGAIAAALASERPPWRLVATDRAAGALAVARDNFRTLGLGRITALRAHWLSALAADSLDAILSNPPYIAADDPHLSRGDLRFEPTPALTPGSDGLAAIRAIAADARRCLRPGGLLLVEHGFDQGLAVRQVFAAAGLLSIRTGQDLAGQDRFTLGYR